MLLPNNLKLTKIYSDKTAVRGYLKREPGRAIQNDYESCNMSVWIDTSLPPLLFVRFPGVGQGCWGATDWSGLVDPSRLVSTHFTLIFPCLFRHIPSTVSHIQF